MRLAHTDMGIAIDILENSVPLICVECPQIMSQMILELKQQIQGNMGNFVLSEDGKIPFAKNVELILDPWNIDMNSKKIKTRLFQLVRDSVEEKLYDDFLELRGNLFSFAEKVLQENPYQIRYNTEVDVSSIVKNIDFFVESDAGNLLESLVEYVKLSAQLCGVKIFFLVNISAFLTEEEVKLLLQEAFLNKIYLIFIEQSMPESISMYKKVMIIDKEGCIITL